MRRITISFLLTVFIFSVQSQLQTVLAQTVEKTIIVNGKNVELKECQKLSQIKSINLPAQNQDSISVKIYLASGPTPKGCVVFKSVEEFNAFDVEKWLALEKKADSSSSSSKGDACAENSKYPAVAGNRLIITISKGSTELKIYVIALCN